MSIRLGTVKPYQLSHEIKSILKIRGNYSIIVMPVQLLSEHKVDFFNIVLEGEKLKMVAQENNEQPITQNKIHTKGIVSNAE